MTLTPAQQALWANRIQRQCLEEAGDDVDAGLAAAEYILSTQPMPLSLDKEGHEHKGKGEGGGQFVAKHVQDSTTLNNDEKRALYNFVHNSTTTRKRLQRVKSDDPKYSNGEVIDLEPSSFTDVNILSGKGADHISVKYSDNAVFLVKEPKRGHDVDYTTFDTKNFSAAAERETILAGEYRVVKVSKVEHPGRNTGSLKVYTLEEVDGDNPLSINAFFAHDIHDRRAQGILNRSLQAARGLSAVARTDLAKALKQGVRNSGESIVAFVNKYRLQLARLLTTTQLAAVLEGAREVAAKVPALATFPGAVPLPPSLEPEDAVALVERLEKLTGMERAGAIYELPLAQQTYVQQALAAKEAGGGAVPPTSTTPPPAPDSPNAPENVHFPTIDEAVRALTEKNVLTRERYDALDAAARAKAFTVAGVDAEETLTKIRDVLADNVNKGADYATFKQAVLDAVDEGTFLSDAHQETVFRTNVQSAFSDGQMTVLSNPLVRSGFPYSAYDSIHDDRVRHDHNELDRAGIDGTNVYRTDDPVFQTFRPPWDYNCRCSWTPMTVRQASEAGVAEAQEWLATGVEPSPPARVPMPAFAPPPGFLRALGAAPLSVRLSLQPMAAFSTEHDVSQEKRDEGGRWTEGGASKALTNEAPTERVKAIIKEASEIEVSDELVVTQSAVDSRDYDGIEERMTDRERQVMTTELEEIRNNTVESQLNRMDFDISDRDLAEGNDLSADDIETKADEIFAKYDLEAPRLRGGDFSVYGIDKCMDSLPEDAPDTLIDELKKWRSEVEDKMVDLMMDAEDEARGQAAEELESNYDDEADDRREYLRKFYNDNEDRYNNKDENKDVLPEKTWVRTSDEASAYHFKTTGGHGYEVSAFHSKTLSDIEVVDFQFSDEDDSFAVTGKGEALQVFSRVVPAIVAYIQKKDVGIATFSAAEPSRQRLYDRLVKSVAAVQPGYFAAFTGGDAGTKYYVIAKTEMKDKLLKKARDQMKELTILVAGLDDDAQWTELEPTVDSDWFAESGWETLPHIHLPTGAEDRQLDAALGGQPARKGGRGQWITIGGHPEGDEKHVGGFRVQVSSDGTILKGRMRGTKVKDVKAKFDKMKGGGGGRQGRQQDGQRGSDGTGSGPPPRQSKGTGGPVASAPPRPGDAAAGRAGQGANQPAGAQAIGHTGATTAVGRRLEKQAIAANIEEVSRRLDRFTNLFRSRGEHEVAGWLDMLRQHVDKFGVSATLESLGEEVHSEGKDAVYYGGEDIKHFAEKYLDRYGITLLSNEAPNTKKRLISSFAPSTYDDGVKKRRGHPDDVFPVTPKLKNKLAEAKHLPGLEKSEDIHKLMGKQITHFTPDVLTKLDAEYGKGQWIVKSYGEEAGAGYGIFFPQRVEQLYRDAQNTMWTAGEQLAKYGFTIGRDDGGRAIGIVHSTGDIYQFGTPEYDSTIQGDARQWGDQAASASANEQATALPDGYFMGQPAFPVVGVSDADRAAGRTHEGTGEGRVHIVTRNGRAEAVPHSTWIKGEGLPVVFEDDNTRAMAQAAVDAINNLPPSERKGQVYAPDIVRTANGYKVVEANPNEEGRASGYLQDNQFIIDAYVSHFTGRDPAHVKFIRNLLTNHAKALAIALGMWLSTDKGGRQHKEKGKGGGQFTAGGNDKESDTTTAQSKFKRAIAKLGNAPVVRHILIANRRLQTMTKKFFTKVEARYGKKVAVATLVAGQAVGWGAFGAGALAGIPLWLPGASLWGGLPVVAIAEVVHQLKRLKEVKLSIDNDAPKELVNRLAKELQQILQKALVEYIEENKDELISQKAFSVTFKEYEHPRDHNTGEFIDKEGSTTTTDRPSRVSRIGRALRGVLRGVKDFITRTFTREKPAPPSMDVGTDSYINHTGMAREQLNVFGVGNFWDTDLRHAPKLRAASISHPKDFDDAVSAAHHHLDQAARFADTDATKAVLYAKARQLDELSADVAAFRARATPEVPPPHNVPEATVKKYRSRRGFGSMSILHAVEHLRGGGTVKTAVAAVMEYGGVARATAQRYVRAAVKAAADHADEEITRLKKAVEDAG